MRKFSAVQEGGVIVDVSAKKVVIDLVKDISENLHFHGKMLNERYLHHYFSHRLQTELSSIDICEDCDILIHPEWPTWKKSTGIHCGRYRKFNRLYLLDENGTAGFIDFAIGDYHKPEIGIEFSVKNSWSNESVVYDFVKLLDSRNLFEFGVSMNLILRDHNISSKKRFVQLDNRIQETFKTVKDRLGTQYDKRRDRFFIISEISRTDRRHWICQNQEESFNLQKNL
jgi:hypothetical protein